MSHRLVLLLLASLAAFGPSCRRDSEKSVSEITNTGTGVAVSETIQVAEPEPKEAPTVDAARSIVRVNSTLQSWNVWQPWEKNPPVRRRALGAVVAPGIVLTTAELAADATFLELESIDGTRFAPARKVAIDHEANLVLLAAANEKVGAKFFKETIPLPLGEPGRIGDTMEIVQAEDNGSVLRTQGILQSVDMNSSLVPGAGFLTYLVKASMQNAASSYSLPVLRDGKLIGVLLAYNSKDQICDIAATELIDRFIREALDGEWSGFPSLGLAVTPTEDPSFRQWLKLGEEHGGVYVRSIRKGGAAEAAGLRKGDVLLAIDGVTIDRRGYCHHPNYGNLSWGHWVRGMKATGESVTLSIWRDGAPASITAKLNRPDDDLQVVPTHTYDTAPNYLVKGGLVFQELSRPILEAFGEDWQSRAPLELLSAMEDPTPYEGKVERIVFLSGVIPTPATVGYEPLRNLIVTKVNGKPVRHIADLIKAFDENGEVLHSVEFASENLTVHLDESVCGAVDEQLILRGIRKLSRSDGKP